MTTLESAIKSFWADAAAARIGDKAAALRLLFVAGHRDTPDLFRMRARDVVRKLCLGGE